MSTDLPPQLKLAIAGRAIDADTAPPDGCRGDIITTRPCTRYQCRFHLAPQDERPGRPHTPGARPPVLVERRAGLTVLQSCMWDVVKANPEGLTADEVGALMSGTNQALVGERMLQVENRGMLKLKAIDHVMAVLEQARSEMPRGTELVAIEPHNETKDPNCHFVTVVVRVHEQTAKGGVVVRKRK